MKELLEIGFEEVGWWKAGDRGLEYGLTKHRDRCPALYAFVVDSQVMYVGKTKRTLDQRIYNYLRGSGTQLTNIRVRGNIEQVLGQGKKVIILAFVSDEERRVGRFRMSIPAALEDDIINQLNPPWNGGSPKLRLVPHSRPGDATSPADNGKALPGNVAQADGDWPPFEVKVGKAYHRQGFFNVPVSHSQPLGPDGSGVAVVAPGRGLDIMAKINRSVNVNGTPRVMGAVGLRNWLQTNVSLNGVIRVTVKNPQRLEIEVA